MNRLRPAAGGQTCDVQLQGTIESDLSLLLTVSEHLPTSSSVSPVKWIGVGKSRESMIQLF